MLLSLNTSAPQKEKSESFFSSIFSATLNLLKAAFGSEYGVMSDEVKQILANPVDRKKFLDAVDKIKNSGSKKETITLEDETVLTLVP